MTKNSRALLILSMFTVGLAGYGGCTGFAGTTGAAGSIIGSFTTV